MIALTQRAYYWLLFLGSIFLYMTVRDYFGAIKRCWISLWDLKINETKTDWGEHNLDTWLVRNQSMSVQSSCLAHSVASKWAPWDAGDYATAGYTGSQSLSGWKEPLESI